VRPSGVYDLEVEKASADELEHSRIARSFFLSGTVATCFGGMTTRGKCSSTRMMARESSQGGTLLRSTPKGMISFLTIGSREENSAMEERRLGWNEEGGR
jgi:hypothetical protein